MSENPIIFPFSYHSNIAKHFELLDLHDYKNQKRLENDGPRTEPIKSIDFTDNKRRKHKGKNASIKIEEICSNVCSRRNARRGIGWADRAPEKKASYQ